MMHPLKSIVLYAAAAAVMHSGPALSQTTLGIRAGLSRAAASNVPGATTKAARTGLSLGVSGILPLQESFSLRVDGGYAQKGYRATGDRERLEVNLDYIEFSGLGLLNVTTSGAPASFYAYAGPSLGIRAACGATLTDVEDGSAESESCGESDKGVDFGIAGGIGAEMPFSDGMTVSAELRYTLGFVSTIEDYDVKNRSLLLQVGVGFPVGD